MLSYRGAEHRPHYFQVFLEDGTTNAASVKGIQEQLQPEGATPPAGAQLALPTAAAASLLPMEEFRVAPAIVRPSVQVPGEDLAALLDCLRLGMAQEICNPVSAEPGWQLALQWLGVPLKAGLPSHQASVIFTAASGPDSSRLLDWLLSMPSALCICYLSHAALPATHMARIQQWREAGRSIFVPGTAGVWLVLATGVLPLAAWRRIYT